ncbi:VOC family protein [Actinoallomurus sp. CA-150999]|uniref:VOC family protein n=1 Tax=Actinoallomurus sp. CA-150999 TaxID=3239887 RepID=UPI003D91243B
MYHVAVYFDVKPGHVDEFIAAAQQDGRDSGANESGTLRFELIADENNPNRFYLNEGYESLEAFNSHAEGPYFKKFFEIITPLVEGGAPTWLIRGNRVQDQPQAQVAVVGGSALAFRYADHVALRVDDYDESLAFYTGKLGFELVKEWTLGDAVPGVRFAYVRLGEFEIELIGDGQPKAVAEQNDLGDHLARSGYIHLCLRVADLDKSVEELRSRGVTVFAEPFVVDPIGQRLAMIKDNSGNVIELAQAVAA